MKTLVFFTLLFIFMMNSLSGQWYTKKYQVADLNLLSKTQLEESLKNSKSSVGTSFAIAGVGGCFFLLGAFQLFDMPDHPTLAEDLLGRKGINDVAKFVGAGFLAGGTIAAFGYLTRSANIKSVLFKNFPAMGSVRISPAINRNNWTRSLQCGFSLTYNF